jgi:propanol-preferring alcohol dehydrogenase
MVLSLRIAIERWKRASPLEPRKPRATRHANCYLTGMRAMVLRKAREPLELTEVDEPTPGPGELQLRVLSCGVCRTDLHIVDGELDEPKLPLILGHQIVGRVTAVGEGVDPDFEGQRMGVPWLGGTCQTCRFCERDQENLCDDPTFTGYTRDGGYAEVAVADQRYCFPLPERLDDVQVAPLLCAGLIGYRSLRMCGDAARIGIYGFGSAAHIVCQVARHEGRLVGAFTRPGDDAGQAFARKLGAEWAVGSDQPAPAELDAAIIFAPVGELVVHALQNLRKGGVVVCGGIHMSDIPSFPYALLWGERSIRSVANLTRKDGEGLLKLAAEAGVQTEVTTYPLERANAALDDLRAGRVEGSLVLEP